jgi:hypothetical protein
MFIIKPSVRKLTEEEVRNALNSKDEDNLIVVEFGLMLNDLMRECSRLKKEKGNISELLATRPSCAMEKIALELVGEISGDSEKTHSTTPIKERHERH